MNIATIKKNDIANGPGVRVSVFVSGCRHGCPGCFNREAWDFAYGVSYTPEIEADILDALAPDYVEGITLLGGEPFEPENQFALAELCRRIREVYPQKTIWCFSGFVFEQLIGKADGSPGDEGTRMALLSALDTLVDGQFVAAEKSAALLFRGSANQRILDVPVSLAAGEAIWMPGKWERAMGSRDIYETQ